jgi:hypothetical protein
MTQDEINDESPWASPEIRESYEAALGRFILAFNQLDNLLTEVIEIVLRGLGREELVKCCTTRDFAFKALVLDLLKASTNGAGIRHICVDSMRALAGERNSLAHGHFDQNPFDGSYAIVGKKVYEQYSAARLNELSERATKASSTLRQAVAFYEFSEPVGQ